VNLPCVEYVKCPRGGFIQAWYCEERCDGVWTSVGRVAPEVDCPNATERIHSKQYPLRLEARP